MISENNRLERSGLEGYWIMSRDHLADEMTFMDCSRS